MLKLTDLRQFYFIGFDLEKAPEGAHEKIVDEIKDKFKDNARWILDTTWIFTGFGFTSNKLFDAIEKILKKHLSRNSEYYLVVWKLSKDETRGSLRPADTRWVKRKFGLS